MHMLAQWFDAALLTGGLGPNLKDWEQPRCGYRIGMLQSAAAGSADTYVCVDGARPRIHELLYIG